MQQQRPLGRSRHVARSITRCITESRLAAPSRRRAGSATTTPRPRSPPSSCSSRTGVWSTPTAPGPEARTGSGAELLHLSPDLVLGEVLTAVDVPAVHDHADAPEGDREDRPEEPVA